MQCHQTIATWDILRGFIKENPTLFVMYIVLLAFVPLTDVGIPHMVGRVIKNLNSKKDLYMNFVIIIIFITLGQIGHTISDSIDIKILPRMVQYIRELIVKHMFDTQSSQLQDIRSGDVSTKLIKLPVAYYGFIDQWKNSWMPELVILMVSNVYLMMVQPVVGMISMSVSLIILYYCYKSVFTCENTSRHRDKSFNDTIEETDEILRNLVSVINSNQQDAELDRLKHLHESYESLTQETFKCALRPRYVYLPIVITLFAIYMMYSYGKIEVKKLQIGAFVVVLLIVIQVITSLFRILGSVKDAVFKWGMLKYSMEIFNKCQHESKMAEMAEMSKMDKVIPMEGIVVAKLSFGYDAVDGNKKMVFEDFNLFIPPKQCTMIEGKIGSGKSTLLKLLNKYQQPTSGALYVNGISYGLLKANELHKIIGYVPQSPSLFNRSIYENIVYGVEPKPSIIEVESWLRRLQVHELVSDLPKGLDTLAGKNGSNISGGQRQIVWFLRILLEDSPYIILDEPTSAMDSKTKALVYKLIHEVLRDKTVVIVSHDAKLREFADSIVRL